MHVQTHAMISFEIKPVDSVLKNGELARPLRSRPFHTMQFGSLSKDGGRDGRFEFGVESIYI